jgi:rubrerythrin
MRSQFVWTTLLPAVCVLLVVLGVVAKQSTLSQQAQRDLSAAMHRDAFAFAKYSLYAKQARETGDAELAELFERTANAERFEHFGKEAQLAGMTGSNIENLRNAIQSEVDDVVKHASAREDKAVADLLEQIRHDEVKHREAFKAALAIRESKSAGAN